MWLLLPPFWASVLSQPQNDIRAKIHVCKPNTLCFSARHPQKSLWLIQCSVGTTALRTEAKGKHPMFLNALRRQLQMMKL